MPNQVENAVRRQARFNLAGLSDAAKIRIGTATLDSIQARLSAGFTIYDQPAPPLTAVYAERKRRKYKRPPIRDLWLTGWTRQSLRVLSVSGSGIHLGSFDPLARMRLYFNEKRALMWGLSRNDAKVFFDAYRYERAIARAVLQERAA